MHSIPLTVNILSNTIIRNLTDKKYFIEVSRQELPNMFSYSNQVNPEMEALPRVLIFCSFFFPTFALFVIHPLQERSTKIKQLQRMTGVSSVSYWFTIFSFDFLICTMSVCIITLGLYVMDIILDIRLYHVTEIRKYNFVNFYVRKLYYSTNIIFYNLQ